MVAPSVPFLAYEHKWLATYSENNLVQLFLPEIARVPNAAFGCLIYELEQATWQIREPQIAQTKLHWWMEELLCASGGQAHHPITQTLFAHAAARRQPLASWQSLIRGALQQLEENIPNNFESQLIHIDSLYISAARLEMGLITGTQLPVSEASIAIAGRLWSASRLLRQLTLWARRLPDERWTLPLDLLARHQLTRSALEIPSLVRCSLLKDYLMALASIVQVGLRQFETLSLPRRVRARLDLALIRRVLRAADPAESLANLPYRSPWGNLWHVWREARKLTSISGESIMPDPDEHRTN